MIAVPSKLPLNGTSLLLERTLASVAFVSDDAIDRLADERDVGLVGMFGSLQPTNSATPTTPTEVSEACICGSV